MRPARTARPADHRLGRYRDEQDGGGRPRRQYTRDASGDPDAAPGRVDER